MQENELNFMNGSFTWGLHIASRYGMIDTVCKTNDESI